MSLFKVRRHVIYSLYNTGSVEPQVCLHMLDAVLLGYTMFNSPVFRLPFTSTLSLWSDTHYLVKDTNSNHLYSVRTRQWSWSLHSVLLQNRINTSSHSLSIIFDWYWSTVFKKNFFFKMATNVTWFHLPSFCWGFIWRVVSSLILLK